MKTKIISIVALSLLLSACGATTTPNTSEPSTPTGSSSAAPTTEVKKDVFTSIKDAVTKQIALKCDYKDGEETTTTYIKGQTVRLVGNDKSAGVEGLMKDGKFYLWNSKDTQNKKGMIIDISKMEGAKMGETPVKSIDDVVTELEKKKENCVVSTESASIFELPSDITFSEVSDLFGTTK